MPKERRMAVTTWHTLEFSILQLVLEIDFTSRRYLQISPDSTLTVKSALRQNPNRNDLLDWCLAELQVYPNIVALILSAHFVGRYCYILLICDCFSECVLLFPLGQATTYKITTLIEIFGVPKRIITTTEINLKAT